MNESDILKNISENLSERKNTAALSNFEVLCNNISYVNDLLIMGTTIVKEVQKEIGIDLQNDDLVSSDFKDNTQGYYCFRTIIPRILLNDINIIEKFISYTQSDDRTNITIETVGELKKDFLDFNNLVTSARQFIDSLVADSYQLTLLEPKETNFQVLTSLNSFNKYATKSIRQSLFNEDVLNSLAEFEVLSYNQRVKGNVSPITKCDKKNFGGKVDFLFSNLSLDTENDFKNEVKNLFSFSSEFTHIGYVSTFFTSSLTSEVIFTDNISPYLPSTENFSELKYEILETAMSFFTKIYLPSIKYSLEKVFEHESFCKFEKNINELISKIETEMKTRNNTYYFFIRQGLIESKEIIDLTCMCGTTNRWKPPHDLNNIYCKKCGSGFNLVELDGDPGYIITSNGPVKVIGSSVPDFSELPLNERDELLKQCDEILARHKAD